MRLAALQKSNVLHNVQNLSGCCLQLEEIFAENEILNRDSSICESKPSRCLLLVRCEEIFLFQFLGDQRCWQIVLTSRTTHKLKMSTTAKDLLSINNTFVQISQDCIVNLTYLMFIENKTLRCEFYPPFQEEERIASHRYFKQLRERLDII